MRVLTVITLLVYWSVIILAPVIAKENQRKTEKIIYPKLKPNM